MDQKNLTTPEPEATLYYDGECPFCRACVRFVERFDRHRRIKTVPLQNSEHADDCNCYETILFIRGQQQSQYSRAVIDTLFTMGGMWRVLGALAWLIPYPIRDFMYRFVGRHRSWFVSRKK